MSCDCISSGNKCFGSFSLSFDGEISDPIDCKNNGLGIQNALRKMNTTASYTIRVGNGTKSHIENTTAYNQYLSTWSAICVDGTITTHSIEFHGPIGNLPRIKILSSVVSAASAPSSISTAASATVLTTSNDGKNEAVKECNGVGSCNYETGQCICDDVSLVFSLIL